MIKIKIKIKTGTTQAGKLGAGARARPIRVTLTIAVAEQSPTLRPVMAPEFASFSHHHRVIYSECTVGNHVYHARYLDILEAARGEFIRHLGFSLSALQEQGFIFPVLEIRLRHQAPARYDDVLTTRLWIRRLFGARVEFAYEMSTPARGLILDGGTQHVCTSLVDKPRRVPKPLVQALLPYVETSENENPVVESSPASGS